MTFQGSATASDLLSDEAIMAVVSARADEVVFGQLVTRWQHRIQALCLRLTGNLHDAEDAMQETFTKAYVARGQFRGGAVFSTWLWRIAINASQDRHRRRRPIQAETADVFLEIADGRRRQTEEAIQAELASDVCRALQELPEELRTVVVLRHYQDLKFREIADILEIPAGTVSSRMTEGLSRLGHALRQWDTRE